MEMNNSRFFTVETEARRLFYQVPKQFMLKDSKYYAMTSDSKLLYGILADRNSLSIKNNWVDADRRIYFIMTLDELMLVTGWSKNKVTKMLKELRNYKLLISKQRGQGKPSLHYLLQVEVEEGLESQLYQQTHKICDLRKADIVSQNSQNLTPNNNNNNNIDNNNTDDIKRVKNREDNIYNNNIESEEDNLSFSSLSDAYDRIIKNSNYQEEEQDQVEPETNQEPKQEKKDSKKKIKSIVPDIDYIDKHIKTLIETEKAFDGLDFTRDDEYACLMESVVATQIQDSVNILGYNQWHYLKATVINKLSMKGIIKNR